MPVDDSTPDHDASWRQRATSVAIGPGHPQVSGASAFNEGLGQGLTLGHADELGAGEQALLTRLAAKLPDSALDALGIPKQIRQEDAGKIYHSARQDNRAIQEAAKAQHSGLYTGGNLAGSALAQGLATAATGGTSLGAQAAIGGVQGALTGLGESDELDTQAGLNTVLGGVAGAGGAALGVGVSKLAGKGLQALGNFASKRLAGAAGRAEAIALAEKATEEASARGALGSARQSGNRIAENIRRLGESANPQNAEELARLRDTGVLQQMEDKLLQSNLGQAPKAVGDIAEKEAALHAASAVDAQARAAEITSPHEAWNQLKPRLQRYGLPIASGAVGALTGDDKGDAFSRGLAGIALGGVLGGKSGAGAAVGNSLRPAAQALVRMASHPAVESMLAKPFVSLARAAVPETASAIAGNVGARAGAGVNSAVAGPGGVIAHLTQLAQTDPQKLGPFAQYFPPHASEDENAATDYQLQQTDPAYQRHQRQLASLMGEQ